MDTQKINPSLKNGFIQARAITKKHAKTFYFASLFLEPDKRYAAYSIYAICRISDDAVDETNSHTNPKNLVTIKQRIDSVYNNSPLNDDVLLAFKHTITNYKIPKDYFDELIKGMYMDLNKNQYKNFDELYTYCYRVAGVIGLIMLKIFGYNHLEAEKYALDLGIAMQLTNILRDIKEDYKKQRIYLPQQEMNRFQVSEDHIRKERLDENFISLLKFQIKRARDYYATSTLGITMIEDAQSCFVVWAMKDMYSGILNAIEKNNYDVFSKRACVSKLQKIIILLKILYKK